MEQINKVASWIAKVLAYLWLAIVVFGLFAKLYVFIGSEGFGHGFSAWLRWFNPTNPLNLIVHVIELLPTIGLFAFAGWLDRRRRSRAAQQVM